MTSTNNHRATWRASQGGRPNPDPTLVGDQACMQPDQDYRQLEASYHHSAQYAAMVQRYPVLKHAIEACQQNEWVGDQQSQLRTSLDGPQLYCNAAMESHEAGTRAAATVLVQVYASGVVHGCPLAPAYGPGCPA